LVVRWHAAYSKHPNEPSADAASDFSPYVTKDGGISLPTDYREKFIHLGTWAVAKKHADR
jgi:hypothetical protein